MAIRILIADDHSVVRQGLRMFLGLDPELEVIGEARDGAEALLRAHELHPDVVLIDLLRLLAQGQANKQIASNLRIGEKTVKTHVSNILAKLSVPSRTQAALYAVRIGLVSADQLTGDER